MRERTEETLEALRAEAVERAQRRKVRRSVFGRLRREVELDEDAATVVAMSAAGATVWQIARYTAIEATDVERLLEGGNGGPAARAEARARARTRAAAAGSRTEPDTANIAQAS